MKHRRLTKLIAVILALTFVFSAFSVTVGASRAYEIIGNDNPAAVILSDILDSLVRFLLKIISGIFGDGPKFIDIDNLTEEAIKQDFYEGRGSTLASGAEDGEKWFVGYDSTSLIPDNVTDGTHFLGGYIAIENGFTNVVEGVIDDMRVRCVAITTGTDEQVASHTDKGTALFATIDCIGITNSDIKDIRHLLKDFAEENNIVSINVSATHCHSCIDTEGLWTNSIVKLGGNAIASGTAKDGDEVELVEGTNPEYMAFLKQKVADSLMDAFYDMKPGRLMFSSKDVGQNYFNNKNRPSSGKFEMQFKKGEPTPVKLDSKGEPWESGEDPMIAMTDITRFTFKPEDTAARPTIIVNMNAHPDVAGLPTSENSGREVSGDYVYYLDEFVGNYKSDETPNGYNLMFFQGAIAGIYMSRSVTNDNVDMEKRYEQSKRFGYEIARMVLSMNMTEEEIKADEYISAAEFDKNGNITKTIQDEIDQYYVEPTQVIDENGNPVTNPVLDDSGAPAYVVDDFGNVVYELNDDGSQKLDGDGNPIPVILTEPVMTVPSYSIWYLDWEPVDETEVEPFFNLYQKQVEVRISNDLIETAGKLNMASYTVISHKDAKDNTYYTIYTEIGYIQFGNSFKAVMMPGEICQDLVVGGSSLYAKYACTGRDSEYYTDKNGNPLTSANVVLADVLAGDELHCFGLSNDAVGYVVPQNDHTMGNPVDHYHEFISLGEYVGTDMIGGFYELASELSYY